MRIPDDFNTIVQLQFSDPRLAELDIRVRRSFGLVDSGAAVSTIDGDALRRGNVSSEDLAKLRQLADDFAAALVSWNLTDDQDQPLPADRDTVRSLDVILKLLLLNAFMAAITDLKAEIAQLVSQVSESEIPMEPAGSSA